MATFETGKTYWTRSVCDYDCIISITVIKRTAKTITVKIMGEIKSLRVKESSGVEWVRPWGSFSMAPSIHADKMAA